MSLETEEYEICRNAADAALTVASTGHVLSVRVHSVDTGQCLLEHVRLNLQCNAMVLNEHLTHIFY